MSESTGSQDRTSLSEVRRRRKHVRTRSVGVGLEDAKSLHHSLVSSKITPSPPPAAAETPLFNHRRSASYSGGGENLFENATRAVEQAEEFMMQLWERVGWRVVHYSHLPEWLRDNDYLHWGHRPQLTSFGQCFRSIFRIHTETGNIWTHLIGCLCFLVLCIAFLVHPGLDLPWDETLVITFFFVSAILALGFSWTFHTVYCYSEPVGRLFSKLDYMGIALLIIGSFVPWIHYSFYCHVPSKIIYQSGIIVLGIICMVISSQDRFCTPKYRSVRAALFLSLGLSAVVPFVHYVFLEGFWNTINSSGVGWLVLMALLYITGALIYAFRIPECLYPGKFDIWFQSHQIFHVFVVLAALVHLYSILQIAEYRHSRRECDIPP
ncbi:Adiponectin receptor protein [Taenia crassiceps]|uniref:Adiponectin receptor protein n=1 Tax=Taenia crassiceps TaxID=6207 RepID=A0ABR4QMG5_9CEST